MNYALLYNTDLGFGKEKDRRILTWIEMFYVV